MNLFALLVLSVLVAVVTCHKPNCGTTPTPTTTVVTPPPTTAAPDSSSCQTFSSSHNKHIPGVCVCNAEFCDKISNVYQRLNSNEAVVYETAKQLSPKDALKRLKASVFSFAKTKPTADSITMTLTPEKKFQKIIGFGGAFTDAATINVYKMPEPVQEQILDSYFGEDGIQYNTGRIPIASCDFSTYVYSYNAHVDDFAMKHFSIAVDKPPLSNKLPLLKRALKKSSRKIQLFASAWAPPTWMTIENKTENCHLKGYPVPAAASTDKSKNYWSALALYYSKFLSAYKEEGIDIFALTTQNEPIQFALALRHWQSLRFNSTTERDWIKYDLGPLLAKDHPEVKIIIMDDQKTTLSEWQEPLQDPESKKYISGVGVHWYTNADFILGDGHFYKLAEFHAKYPDVFILATEACEGSFPDNIGTGFNVKLHNQEIGWKRGENYARDIIGDIKNFASGWTDWNLVLDQNGGPNWAGNFVDAPIIVDEVNTQEFYRQTMFYMMGHFSKFLPAGSVQIQLDLSKEVFNSESVAFLTPTDQYVIIIQNRDDEKFEYSIIVDDKVVPVTSNPHSVQTIIFNK